MFVQAGGVVNPKKRETILISARASTRSSTPQGAWLAERETVAMDAEPQSRGLDRVLAPPLAA